MSTTLWHPAPAPAGVNPFEGCTPAVPEGEKLDFGSQHFRELERAGIAAAGVACGMWAGAGLHTQCTRIARLAAHLAADGAGSLRCSCNQCNQLCERLAHLPSASQPVHSSTGDAAFVLVAGGLGERLGYSGIKVRPAPGTTLL